MRRSQNQTGDFTHLFASFASSYIEQFVIAVLNNEVTKLMREDLQASGGGGPSEGAYVYGLYLEGAGWDRRQSRLTECAPKVLHTPMPLVHVFAINADRPKSTTFSTEQ